MNSRFDRLVDDIAREMTAGDPAPGFRARVLERTAAEATEAGARWHAPFWLAIAGAAVVVLFDGLLVFRGPQGGVEPSAAIAADAANAAGDAGREPDAAASVAEAGGQSVRRAAPRVEAPALSASVLEWRARTIPELTAVAPMTFGEIQPAWLSITQLDVTPLGIPPITFARIGGEGGGRW